MLETLNDPTIHKMTIDEPERVSEGWFDLGEVIDEKTAEIINEKYSKYLKDASGNPDDMSWEYIPTYIRKMQALGLRGGPNNLEISGMKQKFQSIRNGANWNAKKWMYMTEMAAHMEEMGCRVDLTEEETDLLKVGLKNYDSLKNPLIFAHYAELFMKLGIEPQITPEDIKAMISFAEAFRENGDWTSFIRLTSRMKLLDIAGVKFSHEDIQHMKDAVDMDPNFDWRDLISTAFNLQILSSFKSSPNLNSTEKMPEQRGF